MDKYIGFDVDDKKTVACVLADGKADVYATIATEMCQLRQWLVEQRKYGYKLHLTFEVSGSSGWLYDGLVDYVDDLKISNPSKLTWIFRTAKKTDRIDARKMAVLLKVGELPTVHMPSQEVRHWRGQIQARKKVVEQRVRVKNRIRVLVKSNGYRQPEFGVGWWSKENRVWLYGLAEEFAETWGEQLMVLLDQLELFEKQVKRQTGRLDIRLQSHAGSFLLQTIPGVGPRTAEAVLAYTDDVERFARGKEYCAYFGMTPKLDQSGSVRHTGHISKQGPAAVRWLVVESAWRAIRHSRALGAFFERVKHGQRGRNKIAIVATARKMLSIMRAMLLTGEVFNEKLVLEQEHWVMDKSLSA